MKECLPIQLRNRWIDVLVYDATRLPRSMQMKVIAASPPAGSVLVVRPGDDYTVEIADDAEEYLQTCSAVDTITVAGVGSSSLGSVAFAKSVADAIGKPVAGVVVGYGVRDAVVEGLAGFFFLGLGNRFRGILDFFGSRPSTTEMLWDNAIEEGRELSYIPNIPECETLLDILIASQSHVENLIGHSKGNLNIANSLYGLCQKSLGLNTDVRVVTLGCGVHVPPAFENVHQFVGTWDLVGRFNTPATKRKDVTWMPGKLHDLNGANPLRLPLEEILAEAGL